DNTAPILAEVTPVPTPDNNSTPDFTFSTDEAGDISYPGTCSSATTSATPTNNTITLDTLADGSHSGCKVTVTDAAGNVSAELTATTFLIDTVDPVVNAGTDKELKTIIAAQDATVTDDSSGIDTYDWTKASGPGTITFGTPTAEDTSITASADGTYVIRLTVFDKAGNSAFDEMTYVYDTTAPVLVEVTPIVDPTNDDTPSYEFSVDSTGFLTGHTGGGITYGGSCTSGDLTTAVDGSNTTTYATLADATYGDCTIAVVDAAGNTSSDLAVSSFEVDTIAAAVVSITAEDADENGKIDMVTIVFDDPVDDSTFTPSDFSIDSVDADAFDTDTVVDDETVIILFGAQVEGTGAKTLVYGSTATDLAGSSIATFSTAATDAAKPVLLSAVTVDTTTVDATFSEDLDGATVNGTGNEFTVFGFAISSAIESTSGVVRLTVAVMPTDATPDVTYTEVDVLNDLATAPNTAITPVTVTAVDEIAPTLSPVTISSDNANDSTAYAIEGDTVTVSFTSSEEIDTPSVSVTIQGIAATSITNTAGDDWEATRVMTGTDTEGVVTFAIDFEDVATPAHNTGATVTATTPLSEILFDRTDPSVDAGADKEVNADEGQDATISDGGSDLLTWTWSQTSGPGTATFTPATGTDPSVDPDTTISADTDGTYVLKLTVEDHAGNVATDELEFIWDTTNPEPITSDPSDGTTGVSILADTATVTFDEDVVLVDSSRVLLVNDATGDSYKGTVEVDGGDGTSPTLNIDYTGLDYGTKYRINVKTNAIEDRAGNSNAFVTMLAYFTTEIDTIPPVVDSFSAGSITTTGATLSVTTDESATCAYSTTDSAYSSMTAFDTTGSTSHTQVLTGLTSTTGYDYFVRCADTTTQTNTMTTSAHVSFTTLTPDTTGPVISNVQATSIGETTATIIWDTDESATSRVEYGTTSSYGSLSAADASADSTSHSVTLSGLTDGTDYHYRVISEDAAANSSTSGDNTFTTVTAVDTTAPDVPTITTATATIDADTYTIAGTVTDDGGTRTVSLYNGSDLVGTVSVPTGDTAWSILVPLTQDSANVFKATATDLVGNTSADSTTVTITEATATGDTDAPAVPVITGSDDSVDADTYTISGTAGADTPSDGDRTITIYRNTTTTVVGSLVLPTGETVWSFVAPLAQDATNTFTAYSTDASGNTSAVSNSRVITEATVADTTAPTITLLGQNPITLTVGDTFNDPGATANDDVDGDISGSITFGGTIADGFVTTTAGTFTVTYDVSDAATNTATQETRTVIVNAAFDDTATLAVTGIDAVKTFATADDTYANGWSWTYKITVPTGETQFQMKFSDFLSGTNSIAAASNIRFYTTQASTNATDATAVTITAADTYDAAITLDADLESGTAGRQIEVTVEMKVPTGSAGGSYSGSYGVFSDTI
ncbi:MAG: DUF5011 domain-containing protein, partial [Candidatus Pacebacteria bacterium]|nr:DUF5011 domain-containing protein [Candidatus Paceibacterota bacterium]